MKKIEADIVVVGAGLVGSSVAMHLSMLTKLKVLCVDFDLEGSFSSSELNAGGVRATWHHPLNAMISRKSIDYFEKVRDAVGFRQRGYFWMYEKNKWSAASGSLKKNHVLDELGVEYLNPDEITARHRFIDKTTDLGGATFSPKDGLLNPNLLKLHYRKVALANGAQFLDRCRVHSFHESQAHIELGASLYPKNISEDFLKQRTLEEFSKTSGAEEEVKIICKKVVNCTGAWAKRFNELAGITNFSKPERRQVCIFDCKDVDLTECGMFVDASGVYFHPEANYILGGFALPQEQEGFTFEYDGENFFQEHIWAPLFERSSRFAELKHITGWAGLYEVSPDHSAIIGKARGAANVYEAHSFSGRGAMQSYSAGLGVAELIAYDSYRTIDLNPLSVDRFTSKDESKWIREELVI